MSNNEVRNKLIEITSRIDYIDKIINKYKNLQSVNCRLITDKYISDLLINNKYTLDNKIYLYNISMRCYIYCIVQNIKDIDSINQCNSDMCKLTDSSISINVVINELKEYHKKCDKDLKWIIFNNTRKKKEKEIDNIQYYINHWNYNIKLIEIITKLLEQHIKKLKDYGFGNGLTISNKKELTDCTYVDLSTNLLRLIELLTLYDANLTNENLTNENLVIRNYKGDSITLLQKTRKILINKINKFLSICNNFNLTNSVNFLKFSKKVNEINKIIQSENLNNKNFNPPFSASNIGYFNETLNNEFNKNTKILGNEKKIETYKIIKEIKQIFINLNNISSCLQGKEILNGKIASLMKSIHNHIKVFIILTKDIYYKDTTWKNRIMEKR